MSNNITEIISHIGVSDMPEFIEDTYLAGGNVLFLSVPGIGKTQIIKQVSHDLIEKYIKDEDARIGAFQMIDGSGITQEGLMMPYVDVTQASVEQLDHKGQIVRNEEGEPVMTRGQVLQKDLLAQFKNLKSWLDRNQDNDHKMIFMVDEFTSFDPYTDQRTLMNFFESGLLPDGEEIDISRVLIILAANPSSSTPGYENFNVATNDMEEAVVTRMATFFVRADLDGFVQWGEELDEDGVQNIHPYILSALQVDPQMFMARSESDIRTANPRTFEKLSDYFYSQTKHGRQWRAPYISSLVGDEVSASMSKIISNLDRLVSIKELFGTDRAEKLNPEALEKFKALQEFEKYYIISSVVNNTHGPDGDYVKFTIKNNVKKLLQLLQEGEVPAETVLAFATALVKASDAGRQSPLLQAKWMRDEETNILQYLRQARQLSNLIV